METISVNIRKRKSNAECSRDFTLKRKHDDPNLKEKERLIMHEYGTKKKLNL